MSNIFKRIVDSTKVKIIIFVVISLVILATLLYFLRPRTLKTIVIATGSTKGRYYQLAVGLKSRLEQFNLKVKLISTSGSTENLEYLAQGKAHFAFYQGGTSFEVPDIRSVANIYSEVVHIVVKRSLPATSLSDLSGKRISTGPKKRGTMVVAQQILAHYGLDGKIEERHFSFDKVLSDCDILPS